MVILTRRGVLLGATALSAAGMLGSFGAASAAERTNYAMLVACTAYPNLPPKVALVGPNHDAVLVREFLTQSAPVAFKPENVTVLADNLDGAATSPTHKNILDNLSAIAGKAVQGDFVYLHFSGHGSQQPAVNKGDETDGLDEIFLPSDTDKWVDQTKGLPNALMDNEIGAALDAIRAKGAFVWFVIDACHSGTATRAAPVGEELMTERKVEANDLGIPRELMSAAESAQSSRGVGDTAPGKPSFALGSAPTGAESIAKGGLVAFYAAQTIETTPEMPLPKDVADATRYGLFTFTIFSKVAENPNMTYRQLGQAVLQQYAADARQRPTPGFEGELDARVFGTEKTAAVLQWPLEVKDSAATVPAGLLHRLTPGSKLAIVPSAASDTEAAVGYFEVTAAKNLSAKVTPVAFAKLPALGIEAIPANAWVRLVDVAISFALKVARPAASDGLDAELALVNSTLDAVSTKPDKRFNVTLVEPGSDADIRLAVLRENAIEGAAADASDKPALWFLSTTGDIAAKGGELPPLVAIDTANPQKLADATAANLEKIFRATSLSRLAAASDYRPDQVSVEFRIKRETRDDMEPLQAASVPVVNPGDEVHIVANNASNKIVDINVLYVGSDYSISHMAAQRLVPGAKIEEGLLAFTDSSFGMERMIAVLTEAPPLSEIEDLKFLEQGGVPSATRAAGGTSDFMGMLNDIGNAPSTRSVMKLGDKGGQKGAVMIFPVRTQPRA